MEFDSLSFDMPIAPAPAYSPPPVQAPEPPAPPPPSPAPVVYQERPARYEGDLITVDPNDKELMAEISKVITSANKRIEPLFTQFQYRVHEKTNLLMVSVINSKTNEIIREIPPEKNLDALAKMWQLVGILVDERR